jgi:hypothetical protein
MDGQPGVEEVGHADAVGLGDQAEGVVGVEVPGGIGGEKGQLGLALAEEQLLGDVAGGVAVGDLGHIGAMPRHLNEGDGEVGEKALQTGPRA